MVMVVGVRFKKAGKIYYFSPANLNVQKGNNVIVETARGMEFGKCVIKPKNIDESDVIPPLKNVLRIATEEDVKKHDDNKRREKEAFEICLEKIKQHNLKMKLIDVEYTFDNNKVIFYFTADGRVDFRELVKDLASIFRTRIELRQIGVRDEAKMIGGLGPCGRVMCCSAFLGDFVPVSIKMAKEQNLSLNPTKISGICGRLMCCLNYEQDAYEKIRQRLPKKGSVVNTVYGRGEVMSNSVVKESVKVKIKNEDGEDMIKEVLINQIEMVSGGFEGSINDEEIEVDVGNENSDVIKQLFKEE
ncbi:stage 0 sporulation family protein [Clostridium sp. MT-14]|jgi:cell fate regulator YaaT (PSP1 superfamily)|uniref:Stage 0 sporulation family protein n=1 Tax=Clostridium aromativorans TaxID=2836848 RepID=A0ABS8N246_9CLOT|nr:MULTISPECIES: stage 0 sporulation family protein [Clostridium]KAA8666768.1 stage 0 sporulation family protein [Clostridium sp. HV4-5-A1G]MCC9293761.1 stage 0 sporulation family protein [Clostridium aromativorans]